MTFARQAALTAKLAVPGILAQLSSIIMQYIDASMVGRLGLDGAASVGLMSSSLWLFWGICSAVTTGFSEQVAPLLPLLQSGCGGSPSVRCFPSGSAATKPSRPMRRCIS